MCGIAGSIGSPLTKYDIDLIRHRGPDHQSLVEIQVGSDKVYFGHTRLAILDLSPAGNQPMFSDCGNYCIIFNGEIYNHLELRKKLNNVDFTGHSDTETILYYLRENGIEATKDFNGIFAFAFLDIVHRKLYLARDHFGVKPIYYFFNGQALVFSSELKVIVANKSYNKQISLNALNALLSFRYNPAPDTIFKGIYKLNAAHYLEYDIDNKCLTQRKFWEVHQTINDKITKAEAIEQYKYLLEQSVKRQLLSDVPVGLLLSGGLDSAILGFLMSKLNNTVVKTFTIGFDGKGDYNELEYAKETAELIHSDLYQARIDKKTYFESFNNSFKYIEEPIAEPTKPALLCVSRLASQHVKVVLSGQGVDELLAGYKRYRGEQLITRFKPLLPFIPLHFLSKIFPRSHALARGIFATQFGNDLDRFIGIYTIYSDDLKETVYKENIIFPKQETHRKYFENFFVNADKNSGSLSKLLYIDSRTLLPDNLLLFNDKATMANSIENRVPYLDVDLVNFIESLPANFKLHGRVGKHLHKEAVKGWIPDSIIHRKKRGFATPVDQWFQTELSETLFDFACSTDSFSRDYFNLKAIRRMIQLHQQKKHNYKNELFILLSLELWYRNFYSKI